MTKEMVGCSRSKSRSRGRIDGSSSSGSSGRVSERSIMT